MKWLILILFLSGCTSLIAQIEEREREARILHEEGIALLQSTPDRAFDKVLAAEKFIQSQRLMLQSQEDHWDLFEKNAAQLQGLVEFFDQFRNSDSVLQVTRFYPDSLFQRNPAYSPPFKSLAKDYLDLKQSNTRNEFFKIKDLSLPGDLAQQNNRTSLVTFEQYWPLEVVEFEQWLQGVEDNIRIYAKAARDEMLTLHLKTKMDSLRLQIAVASQRSSQNFLRERIRSLEEEKAAIENKSKRTNQIGLAGFGVLLLLGFLSWRKSSQLLNKTNQLHLEEKKRSEDLLFNMLPAEVVKQLKTKGLVKARRHEAVSVMFCDFKDFSQIAKVLGPEELVGELNHCFTTFDHIIEKHHLQKIKTIGDAYMCVGGLYTRGEQHVHRMVAAALEMQQFLTYRKAKSTAASPFLSDARIGIHTGPVVVGVIGTKKIAFDVWGHTVNVAQQMELRGEVGKVNISGETCELIKNHFKCVFRETVVIKSQKEYAMYFVEGVGASS